MAIDLNVLFAATQGDQEKKIEVKRKWLTEVHKELETAARALQELEVLREQLREVEDTTLHKSKDPFDKFSENFGKVFGKRY